MNMSSIHLLWLNTSGEPLIFQTEHLAIQQKNKRLGTAINSSYAIWRYGTLAGTWKLNFTRVLLILNFNHYRISKHMPTNLLRLHKILKNNCTLKNDWFSPNGLKISFLPDSPHKVAADSSSLISWINEIFKQFFSSTVSLAFLPFSSSPHHFCTRLNFLWFWVPRPPWGLVQVPALRSLWTPPFHQIFSISPLSRMETLSFSTHTPSLSS